MIQVAWNTRRCIGTTYSEVSEVWRRYIADAAALRREMPRARILKTDCYNEVNITPVAFPPTVLVDIDEKLVRILKHRGYDAHIGDIRKLPFKDGEFDAVMDFSTLDHVPPVDVPKTLSEYARVLKGDGRLILVTWLAFGDVTDNGPDQFFFRENVVEEALAPFEILSREDLYGHKTNEGCVLREYHGRKR